jgi:serine/threonine protein kinase
MVNGVLPYKGNIMMTQFGRFHTTEHLHRVNATPIVQALSNHKGDENTYSLLVGLLEHNPKLRYGIQQASSHPWMQVRPSDGKRKYAGQPWIF